MEENQKSDLDEFVPLDGMTSLAQQWLCWIQNTLLTINVAAQLGLIVAAIAPAAMFGHQFRDFVRKSLGNRVDIAFIIEIEGQMGWVTSMQARYVALRTRANIEIPFPQQDLHIKNWPPQ